MIARIPPAPPGSPPPQIPDDELAHPRVRTVFKLIGATLSLLVRDPIGRVVGSTFVLLMLWGYHGRIELLGLVTKQWTGPSSWGPGRGRLIDGLPWDQEWISFAIGALLLVVVPCVLIKRVYRQRLSDYGLGLAKPGRGKLALLSALILFAIGAPGILLGAHDAEIRATYPLFHSFTDAGQLAVYEAGYLVFFLVIEFTFRGHLLFGLFHASSPTKSRLFVGYDAIFVSMLSYTAWHLGKPVSELWSTLAWGVVAGTIVLATGTIWPIVIVHWLLNVLLDVVIWNGRGVG